MHAVRRGDFRIVNLLVILGLLVTSIAPFCVTKTSSQNIIEICSSFGVELIALDDDTSDTSKQEGTSQKTCSYCIATHLVQANALLVPHVPVTNTLNGIKIQVVHQHARQSDYTAHYSTRAPPYIV